MKQHLFWLITVSLARGGRCHFHETWENGLTFNYEWFSRDWVATVRDFYCDETCRARIASAATVDREVRCASLIHSCRNAM
jgi:hypothetical protein